MNPFQSSLMRPREWTRASEAPARRPQARPAPTITAGRSAFRERIGHLVRKIAEQLEIVPEPFDPHAEVDFRADRENLAALARDLADAGRDQRRFPADVRADQEHHVGMFDPSDGRIERDGGEAGAVILQVRSGDLRVGSSPALRAAPSPHTWSRRRAGRRRWPQPCRRPCSAASRRCRGLRTSSPRAAFLLADPGPVEPVTDQRVDMVARLVADPLLVHVLVDARKDAHHLALTNVEADVRSRPRP